MDECADTIYPDVKGLKERHAKYCTAAPPEQSELVQAWMFCFVKQAVKSGSKEAEDAVRKFWMQGMRDEQATVEEATSCAEKFLRPN